MEKEENTVRIFIALGANLGDREETIHAARAKLGNQGWQEIAFSGLYATPPWGKTDQPPFLNAVAEGRWDGSPFAFLQMIQAIELELGRERIEHWGPRVIDIDILSFGEEVMDTQRLTLPHPLLHQRAFALVPWNSIAPDFLVPKYGKTVQDLTEALPKEDLQLIHLIESEQEES